MYILSLNTFEGYIYFKCLTSKICSHYNPPTEPSNNQFCQKKRSCLHINLNRCFVKCPLQMLNSIAFSAGIDDLKLLSFMLSVNS